MEARITELELYDIPALINANRNAYKNIIFNKHEYLVKANHYNINILNERKIAYMIKYNLTQGKKIKILKKITKNYLNYNEYNTNMLKVSVNITAGWSINSGSYPKLLTLNDTILNDINNIISISNILKSVNYTNVPATIILYYYLIGCLIEIGTIDIIDISSNTKPIINYSELSSSRTTEKIENFCVNITKPIELFEILILIQNKYIFEINGNDPDSYSLHHKITKFIYDPILDDNTYIQSIRSYLATNLTNCHFGQNKIFWDSFTNFIYCIIKNYVHLQIQFYSSEELKAIDENVSIQINNGLPLTSGHEYLGYLEDEDNLPRPKCISTGIIYIDTLPNAFRRQDDFDDYLKQFYLTDDSINTQRFISYLWLLYNKHWYENFIDDCGLFLISSVTESEYNSDSDNFANYDIDQYYSDDQAIKNIMPKTILPMGSWSYNNIMSY